MTAAHTLTEAAIPGATIIYGEGDWPSVMARTGPHATRHGPENDGTDGRIVTAGDVSVKIVTMPGHTPGTISFLFEYKDNGKPIRVAYPGGTAVSFTGTASYYDTYISSARKFAQAAASYGATALLSNHTEFDNAYFKAHTAQALRDGAQPSAGGAESVLRRPASGRELHGCRRALLDGSQAAGHRQPVGRVGIRKSVSGAAVRSGGPGSSAVDPIRLAAGRHAR